MDKNKIKLETLNLYPRFMYTRYKDKSVTTECVLENADKKVIAVGMSFCSPKDNFRKSEGRVVSMGRAVSALEHKKSLYPTSRKDNLAVMLFKNDYKATYLGV